MALIRPRLTDYHNILLAQDDIDFAIPYLDDLPFCVDPFLLWKSPSQQDNALHSIVVDGFNHLGYLYNNGDEERALDILIRMSECPEVGLGFLASRKGKRIGKTTAAEILTLFKSMPDVKAFGFTHFEEIQLYIEQISKDRVGDIACSLLKSFLIDYTMDQCRKYEIPTNASTVLDVYDHKTRGLLDNEQVTVPINPDTKAPVSLVPKRWLRRTPWINADDYINDYYLSKIVDRNQNAPERGEILNFNRQNYGVIRAYLAEKERTQKDCLNDPLFEPVPVLSAKRKFGAIEALPTGRTGNADKKYEDLMCQLMASLVYPHLDFAAEQSRTESGVLIRDLIFYNNRSVDFLNDIYRDYDTRQIVMELKNVQEVERDNLNQLNRYLANEFGRFGILVTRNPLPKAMFKNTIDLWSGQRKCIICLDDQDVELMVTLFESKQRNPIDVIKKKYIEFMRACPA